MKSAKVALCIVLVGCIGIGTAGCGVFDLISLATTAMKLNGNASAVSSAEWQLLSRTAADAAGVPGLALSAEEAAALAAFLALNGINDFGDLGNTNGPPEGLADLAAAFQARAGGDYDLSTEEGAQRFFEDYGEELMNGLAQLLADFGFVPPDMGGGS
ncbi:MAG: hypothetical protein ABII12_01985 [Planctomycetota bacterium]